MRDQLNLRTQFSISLIYISILSFLIAEFWILIVVSDSFHDFQTFIDAAGLLRNRTNPYSNEFFLNSFSLAYPLNLYSKLLPLPIGPVLWNLLNVLGIGISVLIISSQNLKNLHDIKFLFVFCLIIATSPARAMFASVQHTGVILGFLSISFYILNKKGTINAQKNQITASVLIFLAFEFKPQFVIGYLIALLFTKKDRLVTFFFSILILFIHSGVSILFKMPLDLFWLQRLLSRSESTTSQWSGDNSPWVLLGRFFGFEKGLIVASFLFFFLSILLNIRLNRHSPLRLFIGSMLTPLGLSYLHTYDLMIISILVISYLVYGKYNFWLRISFVLLLIPTTLDGLFLLFCALFFSLALILIDCHIIASIRSKFWWTSSLFQIVVIASFYLMTLSTENLNQRICLHLGAIMLSCFLSFYKGKPTSKMNIFRLVPRHEQ